MKDRWFSEHRKVCDCTSGVSMGVALSALGLAVVDGLYELVLAGISALTYLAATAGTALLTAGSIAIEAGTAIIPVVLAVAPYLASALPGLAIAYTLYSSPVLTASFIFAGLAVGGATLAVTALGATQPNPDAVGSAYQGNVNGYKTPREVLNELDQAEQDVNAVIEFDEELSKSRFRSVTGDIVYNTYANRGIDSILYLLQKRDEILDAAKQFVTWSGSSVQGVTNYLTQTSSLTSTSPDDSGQNPENFILYDDVRRRCNIRLKHRPPGDPSFTVGVTIDDLLYGLAFCPKKNVCPGVKCPKRNVSNVRSGGRKRGVNPKMRVQSRTRKRRRVQPVDKKNVNKQVSRQQSRRAVQKAPPRRRVGKQKTAVSRQKKK